MKAEKRSVSGRIRKTFSFNVLKRLLVAPRASNHASAPRAEFGCVSRGQSAPRRRTRLLRFQACDFNDPSPLVELALQESGELLGAARARLETLFR